MATSSVLILALVVIGTYGQQEGYQIGSTTKGGIKLVSDAVSLGTDVAQSTVKGATGVTKQVIGEVQNVGKQILEGSAGLAIQGLDLVDNVGGRIPLVRFPVKAATSFGRWIINTKKNIANKAIDAGAGLGGNAADYVDKITTLTTNTIKDFTTTGTKLTTDNIDQTLSILLDNKLYLYFVKEFIDE
uniref:Venom hemolysin-like protein 6 n=1 Tax=Pristhesancus plagipennis TaxID=1955184 RepID=A0A2K8JLM4_PRIPG|nr:venom hemolysin-like protein 6 [Pristhesancus plagipennis]